MRTFASLAAPPAEVVGLLHAVARWPEWMPGVERAEVIEDRGPSLVVELAQKTAGRRLESRMQIERTAAGLRQRQIAGWFRRWEGEWRATPAPGGGTTLALDLDYELSGLARWAGQEKVRQTLESVFRAIAAALDDTLRSAPKAVVDAPDDEDFELEVFAVLGGLEVRWNGRTYFLREG